MRQTHHHPDESEARRDAAVTVRWPDTTNAANLTDLQAVIAVMVGGGLTCQDVALLLSLPLHTVEENLQQASRSTCWTGTESLTHQIVAARSNATLAGSRIQPENPTNKVLHPAVDTPDRGVIALHGADHITRSQGSDVPSAVLSGRHENALVLLDAAEAAQEQKQKPSDGTARTSSSVRKGQQR
jgi:hypothetical protein